ELSGRDVSMAIDGGLTASLLALALVTGVLAGAYPALVLSGLRPMHVLRGRVKMAADKSLLRRGLIVLQFAISISMITGTLFVIQQLDYIRSRDLGFRQEQVVVLRTGSTPDRAEVFVERMRSELRADDRILSISHSAFPMDEGWARFGFNDDAGRYREVMANVISPEFLETMDIAPIAGRVFSRDRTADSMAVVVNEAFVREMGFVSPEEALGQRIPASSFAPHEIIGVVPDFNYESLHTAVRPLALVQTADWLFQGSNDINVPTSMRRDISVRVSAGGFSEVVGLLERTWASVAPDIPFEFYFLDDAMEARYREEERLGQIVSTAAVLAVMIACLGLLGLASLSVTRRRKEIGIRKVMGATISNIVVLLSRDFAGLVAVAFLISVPVTYLLVQSWLEDFAYRIPVSPLTFAAAGVLALAGALLTVSFQSLRAAGTDPVSCLRQE
ncbi:MAG: FtsX-like permease family protein, partial [Rhodothermales bacterium]